MQVSNVNDIKPGKQALIVIGMHRSGTSATTGALQCLGLQLGKKLYTGHININPKGYFEHNDITDLNDEALLALGSSWDDVLIKEDGWQTRAELRSCMRRILECIRRDFEHAPLWAIKDPRVCRLLPWWLDILAEAGVKPYFLFVIRSPHAVSRSLKLRDGFSQEKSYLLWVLHYLEAERSTRGCARTFMVFDRFLNNPTEELLRVERQLGLRFPVAVEAAADCLNHFLSKDFKHHTGRDSPSSTASVIGLASEVEARLLQAAQHPGMEPDRLAMDDMWLRLEEIQRDFPPIIVEHLRSVEANRGQTQLAMNRVMRSWSWYTGKPVRFLERLIGRNV